MAAAFLNIVLIIGTPSSFPNAIYNICINAEIGISEIFVIQAITALVIANYIGANNANEFIISNKLKTHSTTAMTYPEPLIVSPAFVSVACIAKRELVSPSPQNTMLLGHYSLSCNVTTKL